MKKSFLKSTLSEPNSDDWSFKRVIAFMGMCALCVDLFLCSQKIAISPPTSLISAIEFIVITCIAGAAAEKFAPLRNAIAASGITKTETTIQQTTTEIPKKETETEPKIEGNEA